MNYHNMSMTTYGHRITVVNVFLMQCLDGLFPVIIYYS